MKLLPPYDPDMAYPIINGIEYPYSIMKAHTYFSKMNVSFMSDQRGLDGCLRSVRREKQERLTRYNFIKD